MNKILLIDDDHVEKKLFDYYLKSKFGTAYEMQYADTIEKAAQILKTSDINAVFLDNRLCPHPNCLSTLPVISKWLRDVRLFVISASIDDPELRGIYRFGVERIIDKFDIKTEIERGLLTYSDAA